MEDVEVMSPENNEEKVENSSTQENALVEQLENLTKRIDALEEENKSLKKVNEELTNSIKETSQRQEKLESSYKDLFISKPTEQPKQQEVKEKVLDVFEAIINAK